MRFSMISAFSLALGSAMAADSACEKTKMDTVMKNCFETDLQAFLKLRSAHLSKPNADVRYTCLDWTTNKCSKVPDAPLGNDFGPPCIRHDFCYGNLEQLNKDKFKNSWRAQVDKIFHDDLLNACPAPGDRTAADKLGGLLSAAWSKTALGWLVKKINNNKEILPLSCENAANLYYKGVRAFGG